MARDVLGIWIEQTEGAKFWLKVFNELRSRGVNDILIATFDGLKGLGEAIVTAFPKTTVQTCIVHLIRSCLDYASWKERKSLAAVRLLEDFAASDHGKKHPTIVKSWERALEHVIPFVAFPPGVRKVIYPTNAIE
jgi:putative transposase